MERGERVERINIKETLDLLRQTCGVVLTDRHMDFFTDLLETKDSGILIDLQPYFSFVLPDNMKNIPKILDNIRKYVGVYIYSKQDCKNNLLHLKQKFSAPEDKKIIDDAIALLEAPTNSEIESNADYALMSLMSKLNSREEYIELYETFLYLNHLFTAPTEEEATKKKNKKKNKK
jgi:hypothetical protein